MMEALGTTLPVFIGLTVILMGFAAFMTGQGVAGGWHSATQLLLYCMLLGGADRFLVWGLFGGELWSLAGYVVDTLILLAISLLAYRLTLARKMVAQYPWIYERAGPLWWREKSK